MGDFTISSFARRDLVAAAMHVAKAAGYPKAGDRLLDRLLAAVQKLADSTGRSRAELRPRLRSFPSNPFIIFYRRTRRGVHVLRILHQRQDVRKVFPSR